MDYLDRHIFQSDNSRSASYPVDDVHQAQITYGAGARGMPLGQNKKRNLLSDFEIGFLLNGDTVDVLAHTYLHNCIFPFFCYLNSKVMLKWEGSFKDVFNLTPPF